MSQPGPVAPVRRDPLSDVYLPLLALAFPLFTYLRTMAKGLIWGDGIELAAVAATLGIAHPTGYPLFTMAGHGFTWLPVGSAYWRVTLMCAVAIAVTALILFYLLRSIGESIWSEAIPSRSARSVLALAGALTFAWSRGPWENATVTEVYSVELLFQVGVVALGFRVLRDRSPRGFLGMALLFGLGLGHHMLTLPVAPLVAIPAIVLVLPALRKAARPSEPNRTDALRAGLVPASPDPGGASSSSPLTTAHGARGNGPRPTRLLLAGAGCIFLGLLPLLYLPIRASQSPALNWGNPSSLRQFLWTLSGGEFRQFRFMMEDPGKPFTAQTYWTFVFRRTGELGRYLGGQVGAPADPEDPLWAVLGSLFLVFAGLGFWRLGRTFRPFALSLGVCLCIYLFFLFTYNILDIRDYELGLLALLWPVVWIGFAELPRWGASEWRRLGELSRAGRVAFLALALPVAAFLFNYRACDRSNEVLADRYAVRLFESLPPETLLLTAVDYDVYSAWYLQEVEGVRRDVLVYGSNFIFNAWYQEYFKGKDLAGRHVEAYDEKPTTDVAFIQALGQRVIDPNLGKFPIYTTLDIPAFLAAYAVEPVGRLLTPEEIEATLARGELAPPPVLYKITGRRSQHP